MTTNENDLDREMLSLKNEHQDAWKNFRGPFDAILQSDPESSGRKFATIQKLFIYAATFLDDLKRSPQTDVLATIQGAMTELNQSASELEEWQHANASLEDIFTKFGVQEPKGLAMRMIKLLGTKVDPALVHRISK